MRRRDFIKGIAGGAAAWPLAARAQQPGKLPRIGVLVCMSSEHFGQLAWQFKRVSGSSGLKVQAAIAC
jgi:hypothetical protein